MLVLLLLLLLCWYAFRDTDISVVRPPELKARTEIHAPIIREAAPAASPNTLSYGRASREEEARRALERLGSAYDAGLISADTYHREGSVLLSAIALGFPGPETGETRQ